MESINATSYYKVFGHVIKLKILRWGKYPASSNWAQNAITNMVIRERQSEIRYHRGEGSMNMKAKVGVMLSTSQGMVTTIWSWKRQGKNSPRVYGGCVTFITSRFQTSHLRNYERIHSFVSSHQVCDNCDSGHRKLMEILVLGNEVLL